MPSRRLSHRSDWAALGTWTGRSLVVALALLSVFAVHATVRRFPLRAEAGYGDSYILYDVQGFQRTGHIYRDPALPPYLPAQYSPLIYVLLSLPGRVVGGDNPLVGPRALVAAVFVACVGLALSITRRLMPVPAAGVWALALLASMSTLWWWPLQIRADFPAVCCSLVAIRVLLSRRPGAAVLAGLAAGLAAQFKVTFVAAGVAGLVWLAASRDWKRFWGFALAGAATSVGAYAAWILREPRMLAQVLALSPGVPDVEGAVGLLNSVLTLPAVVLAAVGLGTFSSRVNRSWRLVIGFCAVAISVGGLTSLQAGANVNYYFESLFAAVPLSVRALLRFPRLSAGWGAAGLALLGLATIAGASYRISDLWVVTNDAAAAVERDAHARLLAPILAPRHTLATVPWVAMLDSHPPLVEPYLLSYLGRLGRTGVTPVPAAVRAGAFDAVFTASTAQAWRGVPLIDGALRTAIAEAYAPHCVLGTVLAHLPAGPAPHVARLEAELRGIGCRPLAPGAAPAW
jgi:hypothetical protein